MTSAQSNFSFLASFADIPHLLALAESAEAAFAEHPKLCTQELRNLGEKLAQAAARLESVSVINKRNPKYSANFADHIAQLYDAGKIDDSIRTLFYSLKRGNAAAHGDDLNVTHLDAAARLQDAYRLAVWFVQRHGLKYGISQFVAPPFVAPLQRATVAQRLEEPTVEAEVAALRALGAIGTSPERHTDERAVALASSPNLENALISEPDGGRPSGAGSASLHSGPTENQNKRLPQAEDRSPRSSAGTIAKAQTLLWYKTFDRDIDALPYIFESGQRRFLVIRVGFGLLTYDAFSGEQVSSVPSPEYGWTVGYGSEGFGFDDIGPRLTCYDLRMGRQLWQADQPADDAAPFAETFLLFHDGTHEGRWTGAVDRSTGEPRWTTNEKMPLPAWTGESSLVVTDERAKTSSILDATAGRKRWRLEEPHAIVAFVSDLLLVDTEHKGFFSRARRVAAHDIRGGKRRWHFDGFHDHSKLHLAGGASLLVGLSPEGALLAIDTRTGRLRWRGHSDIDIFVDHTSDDRVRYSLPIVSTSIVLAQRKDDSLEALDAGIGEPRWTTDCERYPADCAAVGERFIYLHECDKLVVRYVVDGSIAWRLSLPSDIDATHILMSGNTLMMSGTRTLAVISIGDVPAHVHTPAIRESPSQFVPYESRRAKLLRQRDGVKKPQGKR